MRGKAIPSIPLPVSASFAGRAHLDHLCRLFVTKRPKGSKLGNSAVSNLLRQSLVPIEMLKDNAMEEFRNVQGQLVQILGDAGIILERLNADQLAGTRWNPGGMEEYLTLGQVGVLSDIQFKPAWKIGSRYVQLYSLGEVENLPSSVSPHGSYEPYGTDRSEFPIGFATPVCALLTCKHIYNQFLFLLKTTGKS